MPIRKDDSGRRWVEMECLVPGTPEQVWDAIATGPGYVAWFVNAEVEPQVGGAIRFIFGEGAVSSGEVTAWNPPLSISYVERDWQQGAPPVATEITITPHSGNQCVMRMVHSLFTSSDDWDDQLEGFESGWPGFFAVLRIYLAHFAGMSAGSFMALTPTGGDAVTVWRRLCELLDLNGVNVGERHSLSSGPDRWSGIVEQVLQDDFQRWYLLRIEGPSPGVVLVGTGGPTPDPAEMEQQVGKVAGTTNVSVCRYYYGDGVKELAAEGERRWQEWFAQHFPAPVEMPGLE